MTQRRPGRSSASTTRASSFSLSRRSLSSGAGSGARKASDLPSGDQAVCETSDLAVVSRHASPPAAGSSHTLAYLSPRSERKGDPLSVGRPARTAGGLIGERDLAGLLAVGRGEPDLRAVLALVALHDRLAHDEGDALSVGRDLDVGDRPVLQHLEGRPLVRRIEQEAQGGQRCRAPAGRVRRGARAWRTSFLQPSPFPEPGRPCRPRARGTGPRTPGTPGATGSPGSACSCRTRRPETSAG